MTDPLEELYDPQDAKEKAKDLIKIVDPLLKEEIHRATQLFQQCQQAIADESGKTPRDETMPAMFLFLHIIEIADGIRVLLKEVCTDAAAPLLRALLESMLSLRFVVENIKNPEVAMAWYVNSLISRRKALEGANPIKKSLKKKVQKGLAPVPTLDKKKVSAAVMTELKRLNERIEVDYKAIAAKIKNKNWYTPYGGGANIEQLASNLEFTQGEYTFYRMWSARLHAQDTDFLLGGTKDGRPILRGIRDPSKLKDYGSLASSMLLNCIRTMGEGYCPKIDLSGWYVKRVRPLHIGLSQIEVVISTDAPVEGKS